MRIIAQISDLHFGRHDEAAVAALLASLNEHDPDLVVASGDFTQRARRTEFVEARHFLDRIAQPKLVIPGNHDVPLYDVVGRFLTPLVKFNRYIALVGVRNASFIDDEIAVFGLNTARSFTWKNGRVSLDQIAKIRRFFADVPRHVIKVLVTHHPLGSPIDEAPRELAKRSAIALEAVASTGIHILLSGHHHRATSGSKPSDIKVHGSVLVVHAGTATSTRTRGSEGNTFNLLRIEQEHLSVTVLGWSPPDRFLERRTASYSYNNGYWMADGRA